MSTAKNSWPRVRLRDVCEVLDSRRKPIAKANRVPGTIPYYGATGVVDYINDWLFDERLVLLGEDGAKWGAGDPSAFIAEGRFWVNNHAHVLKPCQQLLDCYLVYYLNCTDLSDAITGVTVPKLNQQRMRDISIPLPPLPTQREIVSRLERELGAVDELAKKFAELETAAEAEFKATLKETFDEISRRGAETRRLGEVCEIVCGKTPLKSNPRFWHDGTVPWFTIDDMRIQGRDILRTGASITEEAASSMRVIPADTVLLCCTASIGACCIARIPLTTNQQFNALIVRDKSSIETEYLYDFCLGLTPILNDLSSRTTIDFVSKTKVENISLPLPPLLVQREIIARLDAANARKDKLVAAAKRGAGEAAVWRKAILKEALE